MDATAEMHAIGSTVTQRQLLPPIQISSTGEPISLVDQVVAGVIAGIVVAAILSHLRA